MSAESASSTISIQDRLADNAERCHSQHSFERFPGGLRDSALDRFLRRSLPRRLATTAKTFFLVRIGFF